LGKLKGLYKIMNNKLTLGSIATILAIIVGLWAVDDRYVSAEEMNQSVSQIHLRIDIEKKRTLEKEYYEFLRLTSQNPDNADLQKHLEQIRIEKEELEKKIDEILKEIE